MAITKKGIHFAKYIIGYYQYMIIFVRLYQTKNIYFTIIKKKNYFCFPCGT